MANLDNMFKGVPGILAEGVIDKQLEAIKMLQHIIEITQNRYSNVIFSMFLYSDENVFEVPIESIKKVILHVCFVSNDEEKCSLAKNALITFMEDEIPWSDNICLKVQCEKRGFDSLTNIGNQYCLPIYCNDCLVNNDNGKYKYTFNEHLLMLQDSNIKFYIPDCYYYMRRLPIVIETSDTKALELLEKLNKKKLFYIIRFVNCTTYSKYVYCFKQNIELLEED